MKKVSSESEIVGKHILVWRGDEKHVAKVDKFYDDEDDVPCCGDEAKKRRVEFQILTGPDKGDTFTARFSGSDKAYDTWNDECTVYDTFEEAQADCR